MITGDLKWYTVTKALVDAVYAALTSKPDRYGVVPGIIPWDACDCGMLAGTVTMTYLSDTFPEVQTGVVGNCTAAWEISEIVLQIIRCAPVSKVNGQSPTVKDQDTCAQLVRRDAAQCLQAVSVKLCAMKDDLEIVDSLIPAQQIRGPEGGCVGTELRVLVGLPRG